ncbi:hypothetical protein [Dyadobacter frigoris]|uniref:Extracellular endo-alpha-(1->5)-L-arabinanase C-terminal domain-containing protein n=1 Tax=Dyadobacter frigoris TaxID=2576211 RepID=A0A4U6D3E1_9BACT|nr:hypothetical protein [Dyadobacter frigoris]TKT90641.1 hypothetical protein FDK13_20180 [Dyadobacter frigoris]GLU51208.1 hypothetical protein Dfri01_06690 [Dyadobacter frigoris]
MKTKYCFVAILIASVFFVAAHRAMKADELVGKWNYTIANVPPENESGQMTFELKDEKIIGYLGEIEKQQMKELTVDQGKISFKMDFEGGLIDFKMVQDGEKLNGTVLTNYGEFAITAVRAVKN